MPNLKQRQMMKQLSKMQSALFLLGGVLMVAGAGCYAFMWQRAVACWLFLAGALLFASMQMAQSYEGRNVGIRRLKRIMSVADVCFVLSGLCMVENVYMLLQPLFSSYAQYLELLYNKWVLLLLVAAVLEMYTMHRLQAELGKEADA